MTDKLAKLLEAFDQGRISRRHLLQALGFAAAAAPAAALAQTAQGQGRGAARSPRDTTPAKLPFEPTGWKTVLLDHFTCEVDDYAKEAAFYNALMNWTIRQDDGKRAVLDIGDWGGLMLQGGYQSPPPTEEEKAAYARRQDQAKARGQELPPLTPVNAKFTGFAWGITPWDAKKVEAALKQRGLDPVAENHGKAFESFHVKDPDGFDLQITNGNRHNRRTTAAHGKTSAPAPFAHTAWKTVWLDHISFSVPDYKRTVAFYEALLGWKPGRDTGNQNQCDIDDVGGIIIRTFNRPGTPAPSGATIDHIAFGIQPFDPDQVKAELEKRQLPARVDTGGGGSDIHTSNYKSYHTKTPNNFDLQVSATWANRKTSTAAR